MHKKELGFCRFCKFEKVTPPISRVLSRTAIYLCVPSPIRSGKRPATRRYMSGRRSPNGVASDRVYSGPVLPQERVSSYLAFPSLPTNVGGIFLLHFPGSRLRLTLSAILPYEARTFLTVIPFGVIPRGSSAELLYYYIILVDFVKQLPKTSSLFILSLLKERLNIFSKICVSVR